MVKKLSLYDILSESLSLLEEGQASLEECLARYPEHVAELRPLLEIALELRGAPKQTSSDAAFSAGFERMLEVSVEEEHRQTDLSSLVHHHVERLAQERISVTAADAVSAGKGRYGMILWVKPKDYNRAARTLKAK